MPRNFGITRPRYGRKLGAMFIQTKDTERFGLFSNSRNVDRATILPAFVLIYATAVFAVCWLVSWATR